MIWAMCLSNVDILICAGVGSYDSETLFVDVQSLREKDGFVFDFCLSPNVPSSHWLSIKTEGRINIRHHVSYARTTSFYGIPRRSVSHPHRLPQLWRVCRLLYNETCDLPFTTDNIFHFDNWESFMLLHEHDPRMMGRIRSLSTPTHDETDLVHLLNMQTERGSKSGTEAERLSQRKKNLQRVLPALVEIRIGSRVEMWTERAKGGLSHMRVIPIQWVQEEKDRVAKNVLFWKPLVTRVVVEEA